MKKKLGLIFGGRSEEHEISIMTARSIAQNINREKYEVSLFPIDKNGKIYSLSEADLSEDKIFNFAKPLSFGDFAGELTEKIDVVFPLIHGPYGEDGKLQGFLDMLGVPYAGCGLTASALCMDKAYCKLVLDKNDFTVLPYMAFFKEEYDKNSEELTEEILSKLKFPIFVKPANLGSSVGISKAHDEKELKSAIELALKFDRHIIVEQGIDARELECGVLGNYTLEATVVGEVVPSKEFYDYEAKYSESAISDIIIPAEISDKDAEYIRNEAKRACTLLGVKGLSRVDFLMDKSNGKIYLSEINTMPGFTKFSMYPSLAAKIGYTYDMLVDKLIDMAFE